MQKIKKGNNNFFDQVYELVGQIPTGKVAIYGQIGQILGTKDARKVGWALHANKNVNTPCHRVVNIEGFLADNFAFDGWKEQKRRLIFEGVVFKTEKCVDLKKCLWKGLDKVI